MTLAPPRIADRIGIDFLEPALARDVEASLRSGIRERFVFGAPRRPLDLFRKSVAAAIRQAEADGKRFQLLQRFLRHGPQGDGVDGALLARCLSDDETAVVIRFVYHRIVNLFQGELAEMLALRPLARLLRMLRADGRIPVDALVYVGDTVRAPTDGRSSVALGADIHLIRHGTDPKRASLLGIAEVKSYPLPETRLVEQLERHIRRSLRGVTIDKQSVRLERTGNEVLRIGVAPSTWKLPRSFQFEGEGDGRRLLVDPATPLAEDRVESLGDSTWRITLRWSHEALASAAYDLTFWLMGEVGATVYRDDPDPGWSEMTAEEAGRNAAMAMLYSAILRARSDWEKRRVIALYNAYSYGYALGANFVDKDGRRDHMWPEDLDEILAGGVTRRGSRIR
jgi:hypothetical protein